MEGGVTTSSNARIVALSLTALRSIRFSSNALFSRTFLMRERTKVVCIEASHDALRESRGTCREVVGNGDRDSGRDGKTVAVGLLSEELEKDISSRGKTHRHERSFGEPVPEEPDHQGHILRLPGVVEPGARFISPEQPRKLRPTARMPRSARATASTQ